MPTTSPPEPPLPTFLIIGAQKSATRWLRFNLGLHPDIYTAPREVSFFSSGRRYRRLGEHWYRAQFEGWDGEPVVGEACPSYMIPRHVPKGIAKRMKELVPDVRLLAVLRNPVDRAQSAMVHHIRRRRLPADSQLLDLVRRQPPEDDWLGLVSGGLYAANLRPYRRAFGDQLLVLLHDDVRDDPRGVYEQALRHLGAATDFVPPGLEQVLFSNQTGAANGRHALSDDERRELFEYFRRDVRALERMIGRDLSRWRPQRAARTPAPKRARPARARFHWVNASALDWLTTIVEQVSPEQYELPTPCAEWDVRALVEHLVVRARFFAMSFRREPPGDALAACLRESDHEDLATAFREAADDLRAALAAPGAMDGKMLRPNGVEAQARFVGSVLLVDHLAHGWDLARAIGVDATIPGDQLALADPFVRLAFASTRRHPGGIGVEVPVEESATPTERFVAYLGRDPAWQSATKARRA